MQYAVYVPNFRQYGDARTLANLARDAEQAGWDGFFIWDHIALNTPRPMADPTVALAAIAMSTERVKIGAMITPVARRRPVKFAREMVTLDHLSNGRLVCGVGLGGVDAEFVKLGEETNPATRGAMLSEGLELIGKLWSGEKFTHHGTYYHAEETQFLPTPLQHPRIPVWVAGNWPNKAPFRRAANWDGMFPLDVDQPFNRMMPPENMKAVIEYVRGIRTSYAPFDVVHWGISRSAQDVEPYLGIGVTWWLENIGPWNFGWNPADPWPVAAMHERILQGPPRTS